VAAMDFKDVMHRLLSVGYFRKDKKLLPLKWRKPYADIVVSF
jgi:hypothetical protein